jgi:hypothetical protein
LHLESLGFTINRLSVFPAQAEVEKQVAWT